MMNWIQKRPSVAIAAAILCSMTLNAGEQADYARSMMGHKDTINSLKFNANGTGLLTSSSDGSVRYWDVESGKMLERVARGKSMMDASFMIDGEHAIITGHNKSPRVVKISNGRTVRELEGINGDQMAVATSPDGAYVASAGADNSVSVWTELSDEPLHILVDHMAPVTSVAFSPNGLYLASASLDGKLNIWEVRSGYLAYSYDLETPLHSIAYGPSGDYVAAAGDDAIKVVDLIENRVAQVMKGHEGTVNCIAYSPNGKFILSGGADQTARLWSTITGRELTQLTHNGGGVSSVAFSPDGVTVAMATMKAMNEEDQKLIGKEEIHLWNITETYTDNRLSAFVEKELYHWQKKGEFEKRADYQARITTIDRQAGMLFTRAFQQLAQEISEETVISHYDAENEQFVVTLPAVGQFVLNVPINKAEQFKKNFSKAIFRNFIVVPNVVVPYKSTWELKGLEVYLPTERESFYHGEVTPETLPPRQSDKGYW